MIVNGLIQNNNIFDKIGSINNMVNNNKATDNSDNGSLSFIDTLKEKLDEVNTQQLEADKITEAFIKGDDNVDIHQVMISTEEAKQSLQMAVQVRNKLVEAFQEINRMQL